MLCPTTSSAAGDALNAIAERERRLPNATGSIEHNERLRHLLRTAPQQLRTQDRAARAHDQLNLALEDLETAIATEASRGEEGRRDDGSVAQTARINRGAAARPSAARGDVIEPAARAARAAVGDARHRRGRSERLDKIPAKYRVIVTHRPKHACRACDGRRR